MGYVKKYIWNKIELPVLRIPVVKETEIEFGSPHLDPPTEDMKFHCYKLTGGTSPELGYEYVYVGTMKR